MTRRTVLAFAAAVLVAAAATASVQHALTPTSAGDRYSQQPAFNNKPYYVKGRIVDGCFDNSPDCVLLAW